MFRSINPGKHCCLSCCSFLAPLYKPRSLRGILEFDGFDMQRETVQGAEREPIDTEIDMQILAKTRTQVPFVQQTARNFRQKPRWPLHGVTARVAETGADQRVAQIKFIARAGDRHVKQ